MEISILSPTEKYAAAALFALALNQSQIHQTKPSTSLLPLDEEPVGEGISVVEKTSVVNDHDPRPWIHGSSGLLFPVFRFLGVDDQTWHGLEKTAGSSSQVRHHVGSFLTLLSEESDGTSKERVDKELALTKSVDAMVRSMETSSVSSRVTSVSEGHEIECHGEIFNVKTQLDPDMEVVSFEKSQGKGHNICSEEEKTPDSVCLTAEKCVEEGSLLSYERKITILYELLSSCIAGSIEGDKEHSHVVKGYDARHRVALRLLAVWLDVKWIKMEAMEVMVAHSLIDSGEDGAKDQENISESGWAKWKRGGIIGAAALTGGAVMAITGGLAAPAIAGGFSAMAPTLGSVVPAIGASGFAAAASATGSVAGSVAFAASFGAAGAGLTGSKMAKRIGPIEEFEFKVIGNNRNQGRLAVGMFIPGLVFENGDFIKPWEGHNEYLESYALQWESKKLIAVSTAIQDWLTSKIALELMREGAMMTVLSTLLTALALPATLLTAADFIDSKWAVALDRSDQAGALLAEVLLKGLQGNRPVTLVGFSLGARVIFKCLQCLSDVEDGFAAGLVERVVLLGAPISIKDEKWDISTKMVAGRFINVYSTSDWTLGIAFRASLLSQGLAGIQPVDVPGIENVDVTSLVEGHASYIWKTKEILKGLQLEAYDHVFTIPETKLREEKSSTA